MQEYLEAYIKLNEMLMKKKPRINKKEWYENFNEYKHDTDNLIEHYDNLRIMKYKI